MATLREVNKALKATDIDGKLARGRSGYYYFTGTSFDRCYDTGIYTFSIQAFAVDDLIAEAREKIAAAA